MMRGKELNEGQKKRGLLLCMVMATCLALTGCATFGPILLNKAVILYDDSVLQAEQQLLLLNIVRMHDEQPPHFTVANSISATYALSHTGGLASSFTGASAPHVYSYGSGLSLGTAISDNPTLTIAPMQGKDVSKRLLEPIDPAFVNMILLQQGGSKLDKMFRLACQGFFMLGPKDAKETFEGIKVKDSKGNIVKYDYPISKPYNLEDKDSVLKYFQHEGGFDKHQADCLSDEDGCLIENRPSRKLSEVASKRQDINNYELFRKLVLHIVAVAWSGHLYPFLLSFDLPIEGTFRTADELKKNGISIKDTMDALDKQYYLYEIPKSTTQTAGFVVTKRYSFTALADFDYALMEDKDKKALLEKIRKKDFVLDEFTKYDQSMIIVLLRGDPQTNRWPIYGYFTLRNFRQVLHFLAESLKDQLGYEKEYDILPSLFTTKMLDSLELRLKLPYGCLDNPALTLTIASRKIPTILPGDRLVDVDYHGESFWISSPPDQSAASLQQPEQGRQWENLHPLRWDKEVFSMLYEIFQFNRVEPAVSPPSISISK